MTTIDLVSIIGNLSKSLGPVQHLISGSAYILGILFFIHAIGKLRKIGDYHTQSPSHEKMSGPMIYLFMGALLLYLPSALNVMSNTVFGAGNILTYSSSYNSANIYSAMAVLIQTAGVLWFVRGCVLIAHSSEPGEQHGPKGLVFLCAGVLSMNFNETISILNASLSYVTQLTLSIASSQGY